MLKVVISDTIEMGFLIKNFGKDKGAPSPMSEENRTRWWNKVGV